MSKYRIIWASSTVWHCTNGHWWMRYPDFMGEPFDKGSECEICGVTSFKPSKGRPFGIKSQAMKEIQSDWDYQEEFWIGWVIEQAELMGYNIKNIIKTIPEFSEI